MNINYTDKQAREWLRELLGASLRMLDAEAAYNSFDGESGIADECEAARDAFKALVARLAHEAAQEAK